MAPSILDGQLWRRQRRQRHRPDGATQSKMACWASTSALTSKLIGAFKGATQSELQAAFFCDFLDGSTFVQLSFWPLLIAVHIYSSQACTTTAAFFDRPGASALTH
jgi:hypothetical protein